MMKEITPLELDKILCSLDDKMFRFIYIQYSHAFHNVTKRKIHQLRLTHDVVDIIELLNPDESVQIDKKPSLLRKCLAIIVQYLMETSPMIAFLNMLSNVAAEVFGYSLKHSDFLKLKKRLGLKKKNKKSKKVKHVIVVQDLSELFDRDIAYLDFLGYLVNEGFLPNTALLIFSDQKSNAGICFSDAVSFDLQFTEKDYQRYTGTAPANTDIISIIDALGLEYIDKINEMFSSDTKDHTQSIKGIINLLIKKGGYETVSEPLNQFLVFCSCLFEEFYLTDVEVLNKNIDSYHKEMLPISLNTNLIRLQEQSTYRFTEETFRDYFLHASQIDIDKEDALFIMRYLEKNYPEKYVDLAIVSKFMPLNSGEKQSYFIIAYYHKKSQKLKFNSIIQENMIQFPLGKSILELDKYRGEIEKINKSDLLYSLHKGKELLDSSKDISSEAKVCALNYIADVAYEIEGDPQYLQEIFEQYMMLFQNLKIFSNPQEKYVDYILDAIVFSTCLENYFTQKRVDKLVYLIENYKFSDVINKIKLYRLGNLLYVFDTEKALEYTRIAFDISADNVLLHEETRLNYSVSLMGSDQYKTAYQILSECNTYSKDYNTAVQNNRIIAGFLAGKFSVTKVLSDFCNLKEERSLAMTSDYCIVANNYVSALLVSKKIDKCELIEEIEQEIILQNDSYHTFYAHHNLLLLYYLISDIKKFERTLESIEVPYLLRRYKSLFSEKFLFYQNSFYNKYSYEELDNKLQSLTTVNEYGYSLYMRPILWGLMERWFK